MSGEKAAPRTAKKRIINYIPILLVLMLLIGIPLLFLNYQAKHSGMTWGGVIKRIMTKTGSKDVKSNDLTGGKIDFLDPMPIGQEFTEPPLISNLQVTDLDGDSLLDVLVCDCKSNTVNWIRQYPAGKYTESTLASELTAISIVRL